MTTFSTHHHRYQSSRVARKLGVATSAAAIVAAGAYALTTAASSSATPAAPLTERVVPPSALPGYVVMQRPTVITRPTAWAATVEHTARVPVEARRLRALGFVAGVDEQLHGRYPLRSEAIAIVEQFRSARSARTELHRQYAQAAASGPKSTTASVGIPGATAWEYKDPRNPAINIAFTSGRFYYLIGAALPPAQRVAASRSEIIRTAQFGYLLANGCTAPVKQVSRFS